MVGEAGEVGWTRSRLGPGWLGGRERLLDLLQAHGQVENGRIRETQETGQARTSHLAVALASRMSCAIEG